MTVFKNAGLTAYFCKLGYVFNGALSVIEPNSVFILELAYTN